MLRESELGGTEVARGVALEADGAGRTNAPDRAWSGVSQGVCSGGRACPAPREGGSSQRLT